MAPPVTGRRLALLGLAALVIALSLTALWLSPARSGSDSAHSQSAIGKSCVSAQALAEMDACYSNEQDRRTVANPFWPLNETCITVDQYGPRGEPCIASADKLPDEIQPLFEDHEPAPVRPELTPMVTTPPAP